MKQRIYNSNSLEFYNDDNSKKGEIKISGSDVIINPIDSNGTVIFGEAGTINDIEIGAVGTTVDFTFLGGGTLTSNGNTLTLGESGDTVDLSNATIGTITASIFKGGQFIGDGSGLTNTPSTFTHITASGNISASGTGSFSRLQVGTEALGTYVINAGSGYSKIGGVDIGSGTIFPTSIRTTTIYDKVNTTYSSIFFAGADRTITFMTSGSNRMKIDSAGNVGIGTTSPNAKLQVNGNGTLSGEVQIYSDSTTSHALFRIVNNNNIATAKYMIGYGSSHSSQANQLSFKNSVGDFTFLNASSGSMTEKMRITSAGNVGIGTTAPSEKLTVNEGFLLASGSGTSHGFRLDRAGLNVYSLRHLDGGLTIYNDTDTRKEMTFDGDGLVGIGNSNPQARLHVDAGTTNTVAIFQSTDDKSFIRIQDDTTNAHLIAKDNLLSIGASSSDYDKFNVNISDGKVGMGTSSPSAKLHVVGDAIITGTITAQEFHTEFVSASIMFDSGSTKFGDTSDDIHDFTGSLKVFSGSLAFNPVYNDNPTGIISMKHGHVGGGNAIHINIMDTGSQSVLKFKSDTNGHGDMTFSQANTGRVNIGTYWPSYFNPGGYATRGGVIIGTNATNTNYYGLQVATGGASGSLSVGSTLYVSGSRVGIGTTSPSEKLTVEGNISASGTISTNTIQPSAGSLIIKSSPITEIKGANDEYIARFIENGSVDLYYNNNLKFETTGDGVYAIGNISASGQVKAQSFEFDYQQSVTGVNSAGNQIVFLRTDSGQFGAVNGSSNIARALQTGNTNGWQIGSTNAGISGKQSTDTIQITSDGNNTLTVTGSKIGIGTSTPAQLLHVYGGAATVEIESTTNESVLNFDNSVTTANIKLANGDLKTELGGSEVLRISSSGNVGIGTISPAYTLDVAGVINTNSNYRQGGVKILGRESSNTVLEANGVNDIIFETNNAENVRITSAGNVGIGTTTPSSSLQVGALTTSVYGVSGSKLNIIDTDRVLSEIQQGTLNLTGTSKLASSQAGFGPSITFTQNVSSYVDGYEKVIGGIKSYITTDSNTAENSSLGFYTHNATSLSEKVTITDVGNVGIGTTTPTANLDITSTANQQHLYIQGAYAEGTGALARIKTTANGNALLVESATTSDSREIFEVKNSDGSIFSVQGNGNVGIGTTTPTEKLQVTGNISASGTGSFESLAIPSSNTDYYIGGSGGGAATGTTLRIGSKTTGNTIAMELFHGTNPVTLGIDYDGGNALAFVDSVHSSFDSVLQFKTGGSERFRIGALDINTFQIKPAAAANDVEITDNSGAIILYSDTSTKRIGIGTSTPTEALTVEGNISASGGITAASFTGSFSGAVTGDATGLTGTPNISVGQITGSKMLLTGSGSPALDIRQSTYGGSDGPPLQIFDGYYAYSIGLSAAPSYDPNTNHFRITKSASRVLFSNNKSSGFSFDKKIQIGEHKNADEALTVTGNISASGDLIIGQNATIWATNTTGNNVRLLDLDSGNNIEIGLGGGHNSFNYNNAFYVAAAGNVGIGTTSPSAKLHVDGDAIITGTLTAQEFHTEFVSSSIVFSSGSTKFGDTDDDIHQFTGSVHIQTSGSAGNNKFKLTTSAGNDVVTMMNANSDTFPVGSISVGYGSTTAGQIIGNSNTLKIRGGSSTSGKILFTNGSGGADKLAEITSDHLEVVGNITASGNVDLGGGINFYSADASIKTEGPGASGGHIRINPDGNLYLGNDATDHVEIGRQSNTAYTTRIFGGNSTQNIVAGLNYVQLNVPVTASGNISASGNITATNVFLPGSGKISFDDSLDGSDQFIQGLDHNITIDGDNNVNVNADVTVNLNTPLVTAEGNISSSGTIIANKIGVGTSNPTSTAGSDNFIQIYGAVDSGLGIKSNNADWEFKNVNPTGDLSIYSAGSAKVTFEETGNVGIGTTTPPEKLTVQGNISASGALQLGATVPIKLLVNGGAANDSSEFRNGGGEFKIYSGRTTGAKHQSFVFASGDNYTSGATRMVITGSNGNVGIGTTTPTHKLDVNGNMIADGYNVGNTANYIDIATGLRLRSNSDGIRLMPNGTDAGYIKHTGISFTLPITASGNISASGKLQSTGLEFGTFSNFLNFTAGGTSNTFKYNEWKQSASGGTTISNTAGTINFDSKLNADTMVISGSSVGIGTTSPGYPLHIKNTSGANYLKIESPTTTNSGIIFSDGANRALLAVDTSDHMLFYVGGINERMRITSTGNVGIGTDAPQKPLEVLANNNDFVSLGVKQMSPGVFAGIHFGYRESNNLYRKSAIVFQRTDYLSNNAQGKVHILNGPLAGSGNATLADAHFTIGEEGYVGIGNTSPSHSLDVTGNINTTSHITASGNISAGGVITGASLDINGNADMSGVLNFSKTNVDAESSENFFRIKFKDVGGVHNDVGIGQSASNNLGFNTTAGGTFTFNDGTNGNVLTISDGQATFDGEVEAASLDINGNADISGNITTATWAGAIIPEAKLENQSGTNTGDQTSVTGNAGTVTNGVYTTGNQSIAGNKTFSGNTVVGTINPTEIAYRAEVTSDHNFNGTTLSGDSLGTAQGVNVAQGHLVYLSTAGRWEKTDSDALATSFGMLAIQAGEDQTAQLVVNGLYNLGYDPGGSRGDPLYISGTVGLITSTAPTGTGDIVRIVGYKMHATSGLIYFNPDQTWVELA